MVYRTHILILELKEEKHSRNTNLSLSLFFSLSLSLSVKIKVSIIVINFPFQDGAAKRDCNYEKLVFSMMISYVYNVFGYIALL